LVFNSAEVSQINSLLALVADPVAFKAQVDELVSRTTEAQKIINASKQAVAEADEKKAAAAKAMDEAQSAMEALNKRTSLLESRELEVIRREQDANTRDQVFTAASAKNEADMKMREQAIQDKINNLSSTISGLLAEKNP